MKSSIVQNYSVTDCSCFITRLSIIFGTSVKKASNKNSVYKIVKFIEAYLDA